MAGKGSRGTREGAPPYRIKGFILFTRCFLISRLWCLRIVRILSGNLHYESRCWCPPCTNREDVTPPKSRMSMRQGVDYLTFTRSNVIKEKFHALLYFFRTFFGTNEIQKYLGHGYKEGFDVAGEAGVVVWKALGHGRFHVLLNLPGRAVEYMREIRGVSEQELIGACVGVGMRCSRIDLARDCYDKKINPMLVHKANIKGAFVSKSRKSSLVSNSMKGIVSREGEFTTAYNGDRGSSFYMRCYDKQGQIFQVAGVEMEHCTRFELEIKGHSVRAIGLDGKFYEAPGAAQLAAEMYIRDGPKCIRGMFTGFIRFVDITSSTRLERCNTIWWWERAFPDTDPIHLGLQRGISTPESTSKWLVKNIDKITALVNDYGPKSVLQMMIESGRKKFKETDKEKWAAWKVQNDSGFKIVDSETGEVIGEDKGGVS